MSKIFIAQTFEVVRTIELEVEDTVDRDLYRWEGGSLEVPSYDDPRWVETKRTLRVEEAGEVLGS